MSHPDVLFVSYQDTLKLLSVEAAMKVCEDVYRMHAQIGLRSIRLKIGLIRQTE